MRHQVRRHTQPNIIRIEHALDGGELACFLSLCLCRASDVTSAKNQTRCITILQDKNKDTRKKEKRKGAQPPHVTDLKLLSPSGAASTCTSSCLPLCSIAALRQALKAPGFCS